MMASSSSSSSSSPRLGQFLHEVYPFVSRQLHQNIASHAFDDYNPSWDDDANIHNASIHTAKSFRCVTIEDDSGDNNASNSSCTAVDWNSSGALLAVGYGCLNHIGWCPHQSCLAVWSVFHIVFNSDHPDYILDTSSCIMSVAFHPSRPMLLSAGTFNGEMIIWELEELDEAKPNLETVDVTNCDETSAMTFVATQSSGLEHASSVVSDLHSPDTHREAVNKIVWLPENTERQFSELISAGGDGKILRWRYSKTPLGQMRLQVVQKYGVFVGNIKGLGDGPTVGGIAFLCGVVCSTPLNDE